VVEKVDDFVAAHLPALHERERDLLHRVLVALDEHVGGDERLAEQAGDGAALGRVAEHGGHGSGAIGPPRGRGS
jgi:hypothetical protein